MSKPMTPDEFDEIGHNALAAMAEDGGPLTPMRRAYRELCEENERLREAIGEAAGKLFFRFDPCDGTISCADCGNGIITPSNWHKIPHDPECPVAKLTKGW